MDKNGLDATGQSKSAVFNFTSVPFIGHDSGEANIGQQLTRMPLSLGVIVHPGGTMLYTRISGSTRTSGERTRVHGRTGNPHSAR